MSDFNKGDLVVLKSGGPPMTVEDFGDYGPMHPSDGVKCVWFEEIKGVRSVKSHIFDASNLEKYEKPGAPPGPLRVRPMG